ncbi:MAG: hypothetical protein JSU72_17230 [Deltaproteobacteria bacterium]|nr:MAG: hypothetical protein JSU72_17230 [Deltaproteobacteria bacterium]
MKQTDITVNVREMTDRVMIDLFKRRIQEGEHDAKRLKGTWTEASDILESHFGKVSRIMTSNQKKLQTLYGIALKELKQVY